MQKIMSIDVEAAVATAEKDEKVGTVLVSLFDDDDDDGCMQALWMLTFPGNRGGCEGG